MSKLLTAQELKDRISNNDNRSTAQPYLLLLRKKRRVSSCSDSDTFEYVEHLSGEYESRDSKTELKESLVASGYSLSEINKYGSIKIWYYQYVEDTVNVFLTDQGLKDHLAINRHNLGEHDSYGIHAFRNKEIESLYALIDENLDLQKEIESLKAELAKERSVVDFYAKTSTYIQLGGSTRFNCDDHEIIDREMVAGKLARQRQRERNEIS